MLADAFKDRPTSASTRPASSCRPRSSASAATSGCWSRPSGTCSTASRRKHDGEAVDRLLAGYKGYLVADAHAVYDHLYKSGDVLEVGCWAHAGRYFFKALGSEPELARSTRSGLIEGALQDRGVDRRVAAQEAGGGAREESQKPIVDAFFKWCEEQAALALDGSPLAAALTYARNQETGLRASWRTGACRSTTTSPSARSDAKPSDERTGSSSAATTVPAPTRSSSRSWRAARCTTIEPLAYLRDLLCLLPSWPKSRVLALAPAYWKQTLEQADTQQRLAANIFRQLSIAGHAGSV
jgi:transposase